MMDCLALNYKTGIACPGGQISYQFTLSTDNLRHDTDKLKILVRPDEAASWARIGKWYRYCQNDAK